MNLSIVDPQVDVKEIFDKYHFKVTNTIPEDKKYSGIIAAVAHDEFKIFSLKDWENLVQESYVIFDIKGFLPRVLNALRL